MNPNSEVVELIATLHKTEKRLQELTAGEVDSVLNGDGRPFLLQHAQEQLRHSEAAQKATIVELEAVNKDLETFSYSVSHDLRAPLRHIMGFVELLQEDAGLLLSGDNLTYLTTISTSAKRMSDMIDDLLTFSRTGRTELSKSKVDAAQLVAAVIGDFKSESAARNIVWNIHPLPPLWADPDLLRMVFVNLLSNAVKFTGARAQPKIEIGCVGGASSAGAETVLFIRDNGAGFDPRYASKLFGVFQRLHSQKDFEGIGIGLANVQRIVERHGGRVWAKGAVDDGATFYFSIPNSPEGQP